MTRGGGSQLGLREEDAADDKRTFELVRKMVDTLIPGLKFTVDIPANHTDGKCPILDTKV